VNKTYETDTCQCQVICTNGKRCTRTGTHSGGGLLRCESHHQLYLVKRANNVPIKRKT
jgi:hypothetical protein